MSDYKKTVNNKDSNHKPFFSIVTTVLNAQNTIGTAIESLMNQTFKDFEYIVIDGGSTDKTLEVIKKYKNYINYYKSEEDKGLYDGMNKGIFNSSGEWIFFLNADDYFYDHYILEDISNEIKKRKNEPDVVCGNVIAIDHRYGYRYKKGPLFKKPPYFPHQAVFMKRSVLLENNLFNIKYKKLADFDLFCKCIKKGYTISYIDRNITFFRMGGTGLNIAEFSLEKASIINKHFGKKEYYKYFLFKKSQSMVYNILKRLSLLKYYYKLKSIVKR